GLGQSDPGRERKLNAVNVTVVLKVNLIRNDSDHRGGVGNPSQQQSALSIKEESLALVVRDRRVHNINVAIADLVFTGNAGAGELFFQLDLAKEIVRVSELS